jgi:hypothetical protein
MARQWHAETSIVSPSVLACKVAVESTSGVVEHLRGASGGYGARLVLGSLPYFPGARLPVWSVHLGRPYVSVLGCRMTRMTTTDLLAIAGAAYGVVGAQCYWMASNQDFKSATSRCLCLTAFGPSLRVLPSGIRSLTYIAAMGLVDRCIAWDSTEWENFSIQILRQKYGNALIPIPDKSGGDGGLDAYARTGCAWQMYACEDEPLKPKARYLLQSHKITTDLGKLRLYKDRVSQLLGSTILSEWILMVPFHESSDLIVHCNRKAADVRGWGLPFIAVDFGVSVHTLADYPIEHRALQAAAVLPGDLSTSVEPPTVDEGGIPFSQAKGPLIDVMDAKLSNVIPEALSRSYYRGELLGSKVAGDDLMARFDDRVPDVANSVRHEIKLAKRKMLMSQTMVSAPGTHLDAVRADLEGRIRDVVPDMKRSSSEVLADAHIVSWLQECSMNFKGEATP